VAERHTLSSEARWPILARYSEAAAWLELHENLGLAPRTREAYARSLNEYVAFCEREEEQPVDAGRAVVARYVRHLTERPNARGSNVIALDSGAGLANATLQQRLTAIRLFYDYLIEEGRRETNPMGRGRYTPGNSFGGQRQRGLIPRFTKLPWIPTDEQWHLILEVKWIR
jgi:integrase/recombinase XerD